MSWRSEADEAHDRWAASYPHREPKIVNTIRHKTLVGSRAYTIEEEQWDLATPTYHVYDDVSGECLTEDDAFEHMPTSDEIKDLT